MAAGGVAGGGEKEEAGEGGQRVRTCGREASLRYSVVTLVSKTVLHM